MKLTLQQNEKQDRSSQGRYIFMETATGPVQVIAKLSNGAESLVKLTRAGAGAEFAVDIVSIEVRNLHDGVNVVQIETSFARYIPPVEGGAVTITGQAMPLEVVLDDAGGPQQVSINGGVNAAITDPVEVFTDPGAPLDVKAAPVAGGVVTPAGVTPTTGGATIAANAGRRALIVRADSTNAGLVWLSDTAGNGLPIAAGDQPVTIHTTAAVNLVGENATDKLYLMELTA